MKVHPPIAGGPPIAKGARVRVTKSHSSLYGQTGVVVDVAKPLFYPVRIDGEKRKDRQVFYFAAIDLEVIE